MDGIARLRTRSRKQNGSLELNEEAAEDVAPKTKDYVESLGGVSIFCFRIARALACITLLTLSVVTLARDEHWYEKLGENASLLRVGITVAYVCTSSHYLPLSPTDELYIRPMQASWPLVL